MKSVRDLLNEFYADERQKEAIMDPEKQKVLERLCGYFDTEDFEDFGVGFKPHHKQNCVVFSVDGPEFVVWKDDCDKFFNAIKGIDSMRCGEKDTETIVMSFMIKDFWRHTATGTETPDEEDGEDEG